MKLAIQKLEEETQSGKLALQVKNREALFLQKELSVDKTLLLSINHSIDILTRSRGVDFAGAWPDRCETRIGERAVPVIGRAALLANKRALGRLRDLADIELLEGSDGD